MDAPGATPSGAGPTAAGGERAPSLPAVLAQYTLARLALLAAITGLLVLAGVPLILALLVALIVALPLSMLVFRGLRARLDEAIARKAQRRSAERAALRARLRGDDPDDASAGHAEGEPDRGRG